MQWLEYHSLELSFSFTFHSSSVLSLSLFINWIIFSRLLKRSPEPTASPLEFINNHDGDPIAITGCLNFSR
ncbi:hypothetical protein C484_07938 [Natrialba taiwanensis DSM 12281]|uniref:Uncharacterized protein n=1 Tax=Natrialba taiwanensis DSM 12281 TaxID=1230458 RepID=M0A3G5_9EURY|nr:hypothetical protein C484_07938 [Natrialba taiwanensis DSM 12281]